MPNAARKTDTTAHGLPLSPGPGSPDIDIGFLPAWRALPSSVGASVEAASNAMDSLIGTSTLTPANAAKPLADIAKALAESAANAAVEGNPSAIGPTVTALISLNTTNVALTTAWTSASAAPGGQPAANTAYTQGIKAAAAGAATAVFSSVGAMADMHNCSVVVPPMPHGPGLVTKGSKSVIFNNLPAARQNDQVMEACGGADPIQMGCTTVEIGDLEAAAARKAAAKAGPAKAERPQVRHWIGRRLQARLRMPTRPRFQLDQVHFARRRVRVFAKRMRGCLSKCVPRRHSAG
ncbi:MAG: PAAR domain-containing protein [Planctomycetes bacterium]|nr:PAAR domain-containing protein [Planctomycetota bacterium]